MDLDKLQALFNILKRIAQRSPRNGRYLEPPHHYSQHHETHSGYVEG